MRIGRSVIIPAILTLGVVGSILVGSAAAVPAVTHAPSAHSHTAASAQVTDVYYRG